MAQVALTAPSDFITPPFDIAPKNNSNSLATFCLEEQKVILRRLFGTQMYLEFDSEMPISLGSEQRWVDLVGGATYMIGEKTYEWQGLKMMLIPYIYYRWLVERSEQMSGFDSAVRGKPENATSETPVRKFSIGNRTFLNLVGTKYKLEDTLYGFLKTNEEDYPYWRKWCYEDLPRINVLGI